MTTRTLRTVDFGKHKFITHNNFARFETPIEDGDIGVKVSPSVACLISYTGNKQLFICSGFIMECECINDAFVATLFTSATLLRPKYGEDEIASGLKIEVIIIDGEVLEGRILGFDFHYNVAAIQVISSTPLSTVVVRPIALVDDAVEVKSFQFGLHPCTSTSPFPIYPGVPVFALGRHFMDPFDIMAAPGEFCHPSISDRSEVYLSCKELLKSSCKIKKNGIGGPMINQDGEVIGMNFYRESYTPFLPINIASKCFEHLKKDRYVPPPRPWLGVNGVSLYEVRSVRAKINKRFPCVSKGVFIEQADNYSPAEDAGLGHGDVIIQCCGENAVGSFLELSEIMWDKVGKRVDLVVIKAGICEERKITVGPIIPYLKHETYCWPVPLESVEHLGQFFNEGPGKLFEGW